MPTLSVPCKALLVMTIALAAMIPAKAQEFELEEVSFNSAHSDFGAVRYRDGVVFCSNRTKKKLSFDEDSVNYYTDMFYSRLRPNSTWSEASVFAAELTDFLNEGPATFTRDEKTVYYTTNIEPKDPNKKERVDEYKLGIQAAVLTNGIWVKTSDFPFNSPRRDYNVAHPSLSPNDSILFFTSNMPGGFGGMDLYKCLRVDGRWSQPINLGPTINSKGDELFPFLSEDGLLYFTSNGRYDEKGRKDTDIYAAELLSTGFSEPEALPYPVNTEFDDFAYTEYSGHEYGMISSNRINQQDRIFSFRNNTPNFVNCLDNQRTVLCYTIEDSKIVPVDSLPLVYEWELGDGTRSRGLSIEHCYPGPGRYHVSLNVIDTVSGAVFFAVSEADLEIERFEQPFILSNDTVIAGSPMVLFADLSSITSFQPEKQYWIIDNKHTFTGDTLPYTFLEEGYHTVVCGAVSKLVAGGKRLKSCSYKEIYVTNDTLPGFPQPDPDPSIPPMEYIDLRTHIPSFETALEQQLVPVYRLLVARSESPLASNDPLFTRTALEITENIAEDGSYYYTVGEARSFTDLYGTYRTLREKGFTEVSVQEEMIEWTAEVAPSSTPEGTAHLDTEAPSAPVEAPAEHVQVVSVRDASSEPQETSAEATTDTTPASERIEVQPIQSAGAVQLPASPKAPQLAPLYHIVLVVNDQRIPFNDPVFAGIHYEIVEYRETGDKYAYAIGASDGPDDLAGMLEEARSAGFAGAIIVPIDQHVFAKNIVRTGRYIEPGNAAQLNIEFARLRDIKFAYNSDEILDVSKPNLDYIAAMLLLEDNFDLRISAHTCSMGNHAYNMELSERRAASVVAYLESKGIDASRLHSSGHAATQPIADNSTESGRAQNRRVEFIIVFHTKP